MDKRNDEGVALLRAVRAHPSDDTVRLVYADWLDERDDEASAAHAALIRTQIALEGMGSPHLRIGFDEDGACEMTPAGPDYWRLDVLGPDEAPRVGDRVDVRGRPPLGRGKRQRQTRVFHGLVVTGYAEVANSQRDFGESLYECVVKRDEDSRPWGGDALQARASALVPVVNQASRLSHSWQTGGVLPPGGLLVASHPADPVQRTTLSQVVYRRGFIEEVSLPWLTLYSPGTTHALVRALFSEHPVTSVYALDRWPGNGWDVYGSLRLDDSQAHVWLNAGATHELDGGGDNFGLPNAVWEGLPVTTATADPFYKAFPSCPDAIGAARRAWVAWGHHVADEGDPEKFPGSEFFARQANLGYN